MIKKENGFDDNTMANEKNNIQHKRSILHKNNKQSRNRKTKHQPTGRKIHNNLQLQRTKRSKHHNRTKLKTQKILTITQHTIQNMIF